MPSDRANQLLKMAFDAYQRGDLAASESLCRDVVAIDPRNLDACFALARLEQGAGRLDAAASHYRSATAIAPANAEIWYHLGLVLQDLGQFDEAADCYRKASSLDPTNAQALNNLALLHQRRGEVDRAIHFFRLAIERSPTFAVGWYNLGIVLQNQKRLDEAADAYQRACDLDPAFAAPPNNLGLVRKQQHRFDEAIALLEMAIARQPSLAEAHANLGIALLAQGRVDESIAASRKSLELEPRDAATHSNLLLALHYAPHDPRELFDEHLRYNAIHAQPLAASITPHDNDRDPDRPLRIGYVSADFRGHSVGFFLEPVLKNHDRGQFQIFCYADELWSDPMTDHLRTLPQHWRNIAGQSDDQVAQLIRQDRIDILVDLAGHTGSNRLLVFARKPAPIQITYLGYPNTTGVQAIDYRITDAFADPPGATESFHSEKLLRLPDCAWCYLGLEESPAVDPPPALQAGRITFGSFNILAKIMPRAMDIWCEILRALPTARLMLKDRALTGSAAQRVADAFASRGISPDRLDLRAFQPSYLDHLRLYSHLDIVLDPFPYHGTTTTCEALWMGLPVVTLAGQTHVTRVGVSLLSNLGLQELIARDETDYVKIAVNLAQDLPKLRALRNDMRSRMRGSPLCSAVVFTRNLEQKYREVWR